MRNIIASIVLMAVPFSMAAAKDVQLKTEEDRLSYSIGVDIGKNFKMKDINLNLDAFMAGINDSRLGNKLKISENDIRNQILALQKTLMDKEQTQRRQAAEVNLEQSSKFLAENKEKDGIVTLISGLQYRIIEEGKGAAPSLNDVVVTHYKGRLLDGTEFDSSYTRGEPAKFEVEGRHPWLDGSFADHAPWRKMGVVYSF